MNFKNVNWFKSFGKFVGGAVSGALASVALSAQDGRVSQEELLQAAIIGAGTGALTGGTNAAKHAAKV